LPTGTITGSTGPFFNNWQASGRTDHTFNSRHSMGGRYLFSAIEQGGFGQATPPGLTTQSVSRTQAISVFVTSSLTPRVLSELRISWLRLANATSASDPTSETIPWSETRRGSRESGPASQEGSCTDGLFAALPGGLDNVTLEEK